MLRSVFFRQTGHRKTGLSEKAGIDISILSATLLLE
jgi:hypothetical protein